MEFINFLINSKANPLCLLCFTQINNCPTDIYSNFEIESRFFSTILNIKDILKYLFPDYDLGLSKACQPCTDLIIKMYIRVRNNRLIKTVLLNLINDLNLEFDKNQNILTNHCYLNINKSKLQIKRETASIHSINSIQPPLNSRDDKMEDDNFEKQCEICFKSFKSVKIYKSHVKTHKRKRQKTYYFCVHCEYKTLNKSSLQGHINKNHLKVRQFVCHICYKSFYHKRNLTEHQQSHTKGRDEICEVCGDTFLHRKNLLEHLRLHNDVRPYECEFCGKKFVTSGRRLDHIKRSHSEKTEVCLLCDKKFSLRKELTRHTKTVHS